MNEVSADRVAKVLNNTKTIVFNFESNLAAYSQKGSCSTPNTLADVKKLAEELVKANVFQEIQDRCYESFPNFEDNIFNSAEKIGLCKWIKDREKFFIQIFT